LLKSWDADVEPLRAISGAGREQTG